MMSVRGETRPYNNLVTYTEKFLQKYWMILFINVTQNIKGGMSLPFLMEILDINLNINNAERTVLLK